MSHFIYYLINERRDKTYVGHCEDVDKRMREHASGTTTTTKNFGSFSHIILEQVATVTEARKREKYWKSAAGRRKLRLYFIAVSSSNG